MKNSATTSFTLIERVQHDDQEAWNRLAMLYVPLVYQWIRRAGLSEADAADIGQEVFRTVSTKIGGFKQELDSRQAGRGAFRAWLRQITRNKVGDHLRKNRDRAVALGGSSQCLDQLATFESSFDGGDTTASDVRHLFMSALKLIQTDFNEHTWQAFWRVTVDEEPIQQVADDLGMNSKAVRQAKYRVLKRLREEFNDLLD